MRTTYLLPAALLLLAACDSADPMTDEPLVIESTFEARITSVEGTRTVTGETASLAADELGGSFRSFVVGDTTDGATVTIVQLVSDDTDEKFLFLGVQRDGLAESTSYTLGFNRLDEQGDPVVPASEFLGIYVTEADKTFGLASSGNLIFSTVSDDELTGVFAFETREVFFEDGSPRTREITVDGSFSVDRSEETQRERDRGRDWALLQTGQRR